MEIKHSSMYAKVVSAFPGTGKTYYSNKHYSYNIQIGTVLDSDSSKFDKQYFPANYIEHIQTSLLNESIYKIFVSSHKVVRDALVDNDIPFLLVYPDRELKDEYIQRYKNRGSTPDFISLVEKNWDAWIDELDNQMGCSKIKLKSGEYLWNKI